MAGSGDYGDCGGAESESSVAGGAGVPVQPWSRIRDGNYFIEETWRRGEPEMRPSAGRIVLARTAGMQELEGQLRGRAVFVTIEGRRRVSTEAVLEMLELQCDLVV